MPTKAKPTKRRARRPKEPDVGVMLLMISDELDVIDATLTSVIQLNHLVRVIGDASEGEVGEEHPSCLIDVFAAPDALMETIQWRVRRLGRLMAGSNSKRTR